MSSTRHTGRMDPVIAATLIGIMVSALLGVFAGAFHLLRSDLRDLRAENRSEFRDLRDENRAALQEVRDENRAELRDLRAENRADHRETNARIDRLEGKLDGLILALGRAGFLVDPQAPQPPSPPGSDERAS